MKEQNSWDCITADFKQEIYIWNAPIGQPNPNSQHSDVVVLVQLLLHLGGGGVDSQLLKVNCWCNWSVKADQAWEEDQGFVCATAANPALLSQIHPPPTPSPPCSNHHYPFHYPPMPSLNPLYQLTSSSMHLASTGIRSWLFTAVASLHKLAQSCLQ